MMMIIGEHAGPPRRGGNKLAWMSVLINSLRSDSSGNTSVSGLATSCGFAMSMREPSCSTAAGYSRQLDRAQPCCEQICILCVAFPTSYRSTFLCHVSGRSCRSRGFHQITGAALPSTPEKSKPTACRPPAARTVVRQSMCRNFFACGPWANRRKEVLSSCIVEEGAERERPPTSRR